MPGIEEVRQHCWRTLDAAWAAGVRYFDAARSYGLAEEFLAGWLAARGLQPDQVLVGSKWGYTYTAAWCGNGSQGVPGKPAHKRPHDATMLLLRDAVLLLFMTGWALCWRCFFAGG